jgi:hypothetical protein
MEKNQNKRSAVSLKRSVFSCCRPAVNIIGYLDCLYTFSSLNFSSLDKGE